MINSCVLVGKVKEMPEIKTTMRGTTVAHLVLEADRPFRNDDGSLSADTFNITLWKGIAEETASICKPGDLIGIRGRMQANTYIKDDRTYYNCEVIAEKVAFLSKRMEAMKSTES